MCKQSIYTAPFTHTHKQIHVTHAHVLGRSRIHTHTRARGTGVNVRKREHARTHTATRNQSFDQQQWQSPLTNQQRNGVKEKERNVMWEKKQHPPFTDRPLRPFARALRYGRAERFVDRCAPLAAPNPSSRRTTPMESLRTYASAGKCAPPAYRSSVLPSSARRRYSLRPHPHSARPPVTREAESRPTGRCMYEIHVSVPKNNIIFFFIVTIFVFIIVIIINLSVLNVIKTDISP